MNEHAERYACADTKKDKTLRKLLREPFMVGKRVLALAERLKKKNAPQAHIYISPLQRTFHFSIVNKYLW